MEKIKQLLRQDNGWNAVVLSIIIPVVSFYIMNYIIILLTRYAWYQLEFMDLNKIQLVAIFLNFPLLRTYIRGKEYDKNGKVVLIITFILAGAQLLYNYTA